MEQLQAFYTHRLEEMLRFMQAHLGNECSYHSPEHTLDVIACVNRLAACEQLDARQTAQVRIAALYHDSGFAFQRNDHEDRSAALFTEHALAAGLQTGDIEKICACILATKRHEAPRDLSEAIIRDADLDYLGRPDYPEIAALLHREMQHFGELPEPHDWIEMQIRFLKNHHYLTACAQAERQAGLLENLQKLELQRSSR